MYLRRPFRPEDVLKAAKEDFEKAEKKWNEVFTKLIVTNKINRDEVWRAMDDLNHTQWKLISLKRNYHVANI